MTTKVADEVLGKVARMQNDLFRRVREGSLEPSMVVRKLQDIIEEKNLSQFTDWQIFYKKLFGSDYDFSNIRIPERPQGNWRLLIIVDILLEQLYAKCKELFPCWRWTNDNFDKIVTENERDAKKGPYAIWVEDTIEADENLKNHSANDIKKQGITTETLAERLIHELKFFDEAGKHLDIKNITLCAGSLYFDGNVPVVCWSVGEMGVNWYDSGDAYNILRPRQAVS